MLTCFTHLRIVLCASLQTQNTHAHTHTHTRTHVHTFWTLLEQRVHIHGSSSGLSSMPRHAGWKDLWQGPSHIMITPPSSHRAHTSMLWSRPPLPLPPPLPPPGVPLILGLLESKSSS